MGLLSEGKPLSWADTKKNAPLVHRVGIQQFLALYRRLKDRKGDVLKWGDEVGSILVKIFVPLPGLLLKSNCLMLYMSNLEHLGAFYEAVEQ